MSGRKKSAVRKTYRSNTSFRSDQNENVPIAQLYSHRLRSHSRAGPPLMPPDFNTVPGNTYLFKNDNAYVNFNAFCKRPRAECYCYIKNGNLIGEWEEQKGNEYVNRWGWRPLLECCEPYFENITRAFYANIEKFPKGQVPWGFKTYVCGREFEVTVPNLAVWLGLIDDGEWIYLNKQWLRGKNVPTPAEYIMWFGSTNPTKDKRFNVSVLPSLHRLGFAFLNHILTSKGGKKNTLEFNQLFYIRHLIDGSDRMFNIPFVIISHMLVAFSDSQRILPYGNLIAKILKFNGIDLGVSSHMTWPTNLWANLTAHGWKLEEIDEATGARVYRTKNKPVDQWIAEPNALPNQYWNPNQEQPQVQTEAGGSSSQTGYSDDFQKSVLEALANLSTTNTKLDQIIQTQAKHTEEIEKLKANYNGFNEWARGSYRNLYEDYQTLKFWFVVRFGPDDDDDEIPSVTSDDDEGDDNGSDGNNDPMEP